MNEVKKEIIIPKEEAVFWMDERGHWCNAHGPFVHKKIIAYFNNAIRRDHRGYFVEQTTQNTVEKVYFKYDDTPLFIIEVVENESIILVLNTGDRSPLDPERLFTAQDHLYYRRGDERIRFSENALIQLRHRIEYRNDQYLYIHNGQTHIIPELIP